MASSGATAGCTFPPTGLLSGGKFNTGSDAMMMDYLWTLYCQTPYLMIDSLQTGREQVLLGTEELSLEDIRQKISCQMGRILKELIDRGADACFMIIGGDTLLAFMRLHRLPRADTGM